MLFNSIEYALFLPIVFLLYWFVTVKKYQWQNLLLLISSYVFYGWWDWRFLSLIIISSLTDYIVGILLEKEDRDKRRKLLLAISVLINLGILSYFKYFNFFINSFVEMFTSMGIHFNSRSLNIILPVGISFYTFQTMSYTIDIYKKTFKPTKNWVNFFAYVSFFPQLVAGPIERASNLLPQFEKKRVFSMEKASNGMRQILWGLFSKILVADNLAVYVDKVFANTDAYPPGILLLSIILFSIQIYADFSGYSNIAIGTAKLFGFSLMQNFNSPYISKNITEMWRRWHISLSTWLRDYLFIPLSIRFRNLGNSGIVLAIFITFVLCGLWHGPKWTFIFFGFWQSIALVFEFITTKSRRKIRKKVNGLLYNSVSILLTFFFWQFSMLFFRANSVNEAFMVLNKVMSMDLFTSFGHNIRLLFDNMAILKLSIILTFLIIMEIIYKNKEYAFVIQNVNKYLRISLYIFVAILILLFSPIEGSSFIYFQF